MCLALLPRAVQIIKYGAIWHLSASSCVYVANYEKSAERHALRHATWSRCAAGQVMQAPHAKELCRQERGCAVRVTPTVVRAVEAVLRSDLEFGISALLAPTEEALKQLAPKVSNPHLCPHDSSCDTNLYSADKSVQSAQPIY